MTRAISGINIIIMKKTLFLCFSCSLGIFGNLKPNTNLIYILEQRTEQLHKKWLATKCRLFRLYRLCLSTLWSPTNAQLS